MLTWNNIKYVGVTNWDIKIRFCYILYNFEYFGGIFRNGGTNGLAEICHARYVECCKCKWKDIQLFSGSFRGEIQLDGNINKDKQKVRCQEVGQRRDKDVKWSWLRWHCCRKTFPADIQKNLGENPTKSGKNEKSGPEEGLWTRLRWRKLLQPNLFSINKSNPKKIEEFIDLRWRSLCQR